MIYKVQRGPAGWMLAMAIVLAAGVARADETPAAQVSATSQPTSQPTSAPGERGDSLPGRLLMLRDDDRESFLADHQADPKLLWRATASAAVVLVLGAIAFVVSKKVVPRLQSAGGRQVRVLETTYLGPRKSVHLLAVGGRKYLVSSTREQVGMLADVTGSFDEALASACEPPSASTGPIDPEERQS